MNTIFGYQYFDSDPDEVEKENNPIDLEKAIDLFNTFPWNEQFKGISKREETNLSSTTPTLYFYEATEKFLSVSALSDDGFLVNYRDDDKFGELFISNNILEKPEGISVEQFIDDFFNHKVEETLELYEFEQGSKEAIHYNLNYNKAKLYRPLLFLLLPYLSVFYDDYDPALFLPFLILMSGFIFISILPNLLLNFKYWKNDKDQTIGYDPIQKILTITRKNETYEIPKSEIESFDLVRPRTSQRAFQDYSYLRLKTSDNTFAVTYLLVDPTELLTLLNVNFRDIEVYYPKLDLNLETGKQKEKRQHLYQQKRTEFLQTYSSWETGKLEEVVAKNDHYADYARSAATEILKKRKAVNKV